LLLALGVLAFCGFMVAFLPASSMTGLLPASMRADGLTGTVWSGRAQSVRAGHMMLGAMTWRCSALRLFVARLDCDMALDLSPGRVDARVVVTPRGIVSVSHLRGTVPLASAAALGIPQGWSGQLRFEDVGAVMDSGRPTALAGTIVATDLRPPHRPGAMLGSYAIELGEGFSTPGVPGGRLRNLDGPLSLRGTLRIEPAGSYLAQGEIAPVPGAPDDLLQALTFLGPPDSSGRRSFSLEGTF
jgi:hypothetical protein